MSNFSFDSITKGNRTSESTYPAYTGRVDGIRLLNRCLARLILISEDFLPCGLMRAMNGSQPSALQFVGDVISAMSVRIAGILCCKTAEIT